MAKRMALGKGMGSLISKAANPVVSQELKNKMNEINSTTKPKIAAKVVTEIETHPSLISISQIITNPDQPRKVFKDKDLEELSASISENGIIQPLIIAKTQNGFELIAGERRLRAAKLAGLKQVPVVIKKVSEKDRMIMSIIENIQRTDLNCVEEALAFYQLMDTYNLTQEEVAKKLGKDRSNIANHLRILKLPKEVIHLLQKETLSFGHAKVLASIKEGEQIIRLANIAAVESLSVRELEKLIKSKGKAKKESSSNPFFNEKLDVFKQKLEKRTGFHFQMKTGKNGSGQISLKYSNEAEFNDIYEYLLEK